WLPGDRHCHHRGSASAGAGAAGRHRALPPDQPGGRGSCLAPAHRLARPSRLSRYYFSKGLTRKRRPPMLNHVITPCIDQQKCLEPVADFLQKVVGGTYKLLGAPGHTLKTFVHGTWLGHPLHPVITDIPVGAWTLA